MVRILFAIGINLLIYSTAFAQTGSDFMQKEGARADEIVIPAVALAPIVPVAYYYAYGIWPDSWDAIREAGIWQTPMVFDLTRTIDPGDGNWDFPGDMQYVPQGAQTQPRIASYDASGRVTFLPTYLLSDPATWVELVQAQARLSDQDTSTLLSNQSQRNLLSLAGMVQVGARSFIEFHGRGPTTWQELMNSGFSPIDSNSFNPVTGGPIYGDGRPNDIMFKPYDMGFTIYATDANGEVLFGSSLPF